MLLPSLPVHQRGIADVRGRVKGADKEKKKDMEDKIGDIITLSDDTKAIVEEANQMLPCSWCALWLTSDCEERICDRIARTDHKNIIYKAMED